MDRDLACGIGVEEVRMPRIAKRRDTTVDMRNPMKVDGQRLPLPPGQGPQGNNRPLHSLNPSAGTWGATPNAHCNFATYLKNVKKDYDGAEKEYKEALRVDPNHAIAHLNFANFLTSIRNSHEEAFIHYEAAVRISPNDADTHYNYAVFLKNVRQDYPSATREFLSSLRVDPDSVRTRLSYASLLGTTRQFDQAEVQYMEVLRLHPGNDKAQNGLVWITRLRAESVDTCNSGLASVDTINPLGLASASGNRKTATGHDTLMPPMALDPTPSVEGSPKASLKGSRQE